MTARLLSLGTAVPAMWRTQASACAEQADLWRLSDSERARWEKILKGCGIERRHAVRQMTEVMDLDTAERMKVFEEEAPALAAKAATQALERAGVSADQVTDLVAVSCTGFSAPGVPRQLVERLGLSRRVRTNQVGFMGCFGGVCGLRTAAGHASADRAGVVLLVCVELCSLHLRADRDPQNLVASALFADGAAAAVIAGAEAPVEGSSIGHISPGRSLIIPDTLDAMTWVITDAGFAMTLSREVPKALGESLPGLIAGRGAAVLHPGGRAILDAAEESMKNGQRGALGASRAVLRDYGNMSSGTVLFVLDAWLRDGGQPPACLVAFGPGLTIDTVDLSPP